ncbi:MAG: hypothetical protein K2Q26_13360 [Bdellovibrionales bacterium]|nr:hypothetical protein [Bdellovibrionales bacterium]
MDSTKTPAWKEHFTQFAESSESLAELIESHRLPIEDYLEWASEHYELPVLQDHFFDDVDVKPLLKKYPSNAWNSTCFPASEWEGVLYIACLEPAVVALQQEHCFVLANYEILSKTWRSMPAETPAPEDKPLRSELLNTPAPEAFGFDFNFGGVDIASEGSPATAEERPALEQAGAVTSQFESEITQDILPKEGWAASLPTSPTSPTMPSDLASLDFGSLGIASTEKTSEDEAPQSSKAELPPPVSAAPSPLPSLFEHTETAVAPVAEEKILPSFDNLLDPKEVPAHLANNAPVTLVRTEVPSPVIANDVSFTSTKTIMPFPEKTQNFTFTRTVYTEQLILSAASKIEEASQPAEALLSAFKQLKDYYQKLMWCVRDNQGRVFPIACNNTWDFDETAWNYCFDFKTPNPFRIAKLTSKPFHGPISKNVPSDLFFKVWNNGKYPDHMTVYPVAIGGKNFGYLLGCDKGTHFQSEQTLEAMQNVCEALLSSFIKIHREIKDAA